MTPSHTSHTVLVTGITGFVGSHVAQQLLAAGFTVRGTLRSLSKSEEVFAKLLPAAADRSCLDLKEIDLLDPPEKWEDVVRGCSYIQHVASPFPLTPPKDESLLIRPALDGTLNLFRAALKVGGVKRIVLTSSIVAVSQGREDEYDIHARDEKLIKKGHVFTDDDWTDVNQCSAYPKSKTLAEKAAWDFIKENNNPFELAVINPGLILGPFLLPYFGTSADVPKSILMRLYPMLPHPMFFQIVDVRDVAFLQIRAMEVAEAVGHRHIATPHTATLLKISVMLRDKFASKGFNPPTHTLPSFLLYIASWFDPAMKMLNKSIGKNAVFDISGTEKRLGITWRTLEETLADTGNSLIELGFVTANS